MFYSQYILAKRGPLGTIWIAAHLDRRLRKQQITETDVATAVRACPRVVASPRMDVSSRVRQTSSDLAQSHAIPARPFAHPRPLPSRRPCPSQPESIVNPDAPLALRLSGQLMLGVVRIYSRKVNYLFQDCSEALVKIKQAFKPGGRDDVDLPEGAETAPLGAITLPENYDDLELFFEPGGAFGAQATHPSGGDDDGREGVDDITLERANPFEMEDDFDRFYAYDDRVHGDVGDDDAFIEDELDPRLHPEPGFRVGDGPRAYGESDPNERVDAEGVENYDAAADDDDAFGSGGAFDDGGASTPGGAPNANEDDAEAPPPLPLDDDLEDETGARGTVVGFKTPPAAERAGGKENAPADPNTASTAGVTAEWGKTAQKSKRPEGFAKRARRKRETMKIKFDAATMLSNERVKANIRDASDIVARRGAGARARVADAADDDAPTVRPPRARARLGGGSVFRSARPRLGGTRGGGWVFPRVLPRAVRVGAAAGVRGGGAGRAPRASRAGGIP